MRFDLSWDEQIQLNHFERDVTAYAREIRELAYADPEEAMLKLTSLVGICGEHRSRLLRKEREQSGEPSAIPAVETASCIL